MQNPFKKLDIVALNAFADKLDDRSLFTFCKTDKYFKEKICDDEKFWKRRLESKYPLLWRYKSVKDSYRSFYLFMSKYIAKLEEKFGIPYLPSWKYNPLNFYQTHKDTYNRIYDEALYYAAHSNRIDLIEILIEKGGKDLHMAMNGAIDSGNLDIVKFLLNKGASVTDFDMWQASGKGYLDIVKYLIQMGADDLYAGLRWAVRDGQLKVVKYFIEEKGLNISPNLLMLAKKEENKDIVDYLKSKMTK